MQGGRADSEIHFTFPLSFIEGDVALAGIRGERYRKRDALRPLQRKSEAPTAFGTSPKFGGGVFKPKFLLRIWGRKGGGQKQVAPRDAPSSCKWTGGVFYCDDGL